MIRWAHRLGIIDQPNARSSHTQPTPRGGGLAIVGVGLLAIVALIAAGISPPRGGGWVLAAAAIVAVVSGIDDLASLSPRLRLPVHFFAALIAVLSVGPVDALDFGPLGRFDLGIAGWPLTIIWIVGMTNAFNFMDGIDGIAALTALFALAVLAAGLNIAEEPFPSFTAAAIAAASAGFLIWNWQPARIFMGDVGSAFLGFTIAAIPLLADREARAWLMPLTALLMWPFIADTTYTLIQRLRRGEDVLEAHRSHIYQRLVAAGCSHEVVALLYVVASIAAAVASVANIEHSATP